jgi:hypothetical protein
VKCRQAVVEEIGQSNPLRLLETLQARCGGACHGSALPILRTGADVSFSVRRPRSEAQELRLVVHVMASPANCALFQARVSSVPSRDCNI